MQYTANLLLTGLTLLTLCVLIFENSRIEQDEKERFYLTYGMIFFAACTEWLSVGLNGAPLWTRRIHIVIKGMDYIFTPVIGILFIRQFGRKQNQKKEQERNRVLMVLLLVNAALQFVSFFTGLTYSVDSSNVYHHGPWYGVYMVIYGVVLALVVWELSAYSKGFRSENRKSLIMIVLITALGIGVQEMTGGEIRMIYLALAVSSVLLYIQAQS